jgi:hypothetical protein
VITAVFPVIRAADAAVLTLQPVRIEYGPDAILDGLERIRHAD